MEPEDGHKVDRKDDEGGGSSKIVVVKNAWGWPVGEVESYERVTSQEHAEKPRFRPQEGPHGQLVLRYLAEGPTLALLFFRKSESASVVVPGPAEDSPSENDKTDDNYW